LVSYLWIRLWPFARIAWALPILTAIDRFGLKLNQSRAAFVECGLDAK
jgi:hypothetical protein